MKCVDCGHKLWKNGVRSNGKRKYKCPKCGSCKSPHNHLGGDADAVTIKSTTNRSQVSSKSICTLDDLIAVADIDLEEWLVDRYKVNKWDTTAQIDGELVSKPNFQIKANMIKKNPEGVNFKPLQQVTVDSDYHCPGMHFKHSDQGIEKAMFISDLHIGYKRDLETEAMIPYHDPMAVGTVTEMIAHIKPETIVLGGDILDFEEISTHYTRSPECMFTTQYALKTAARVLSQWRRFCDRMIYIEGNHEKRLSQNIIENFVGAYNLKSVKDLGNPVMSLQNLLALDELDIEYIDGYPHAHTWLFDKVKCKHGNIIRKNPGATAQALLKKTQYSLVVGHAHREESASKTMHDIDGVSPHKVQVNGGLMRLDGIVPGSPEEPAWNQSVSLITNGDMFSIAPIFIYNGSAIYPTEHFNIT